MKTIEEKAKRFDEVLAMAKECITYVPDGAVNQYMLDMFPELKESEGEKIRKVLIGWINLEPSTSFNDTFDGFSKEQILAWLEKQGNTNIFDVPKISIKNAVEVTSRMQYIDDDIKPIAEFIMDYANWDLHKDEWNHPTLTVPLFRVLDALIQKGKPYCVCNQNIEKQGEHNPADKVEPKFKVSDYVVDNCGYVWRIEGIINQFYILEGIDGGESRPTIEWVNKTFHLWDITEDAKDGDVLVNGSNTFVFHCINDTRLMGYCHVNTNDGRFYDDIGKNECFCLIDAVVNPATKEQCDTLMKAMADAGYTFDFEKKKLKKLKFKVGDEVITKNEKSLTITQIDEKGYWSDDLFICNFDSEFNWNLVEQKHT